jgi:tetratricopeptide (TPR) repeat protein
VRKLGMRGYANYMIGNASELAMRMGDWDWAIAELEEAVATSDTDNAARMRRAEILGLRGEDVESEFQFLTERVEKMTELQAQSSVGEVRALVALARGEFTQALDLARRAYQITTAPDATAPQTAIRAASWLGDAASVADSLGVLEGMPGRAAAAIRREGQAALAALQGRRGEALADFLEAVRRWRELGLEFEAAVCGLSLVTMLGPSDPEARAAAGDAGAVFERLGAKPLVKLLEEALRSTPVVAEPRPGSVNVEEPTVRASSE